MKKIITLLGLAVLIVSSISCKKQDDDFPPYYQVAVEWKVTSSTGSPTDFSNILNVIDPYINTDFKSEKEAVNLYNQLLAKTKDASYTASYDSYVKFFIRRYIAKQESESVIRYDVDPKYTSPVAHIWDKDGSRDLK